MAELVPIHRDIHNYMNPLTRMWKTTNYLMGSRVGEADNPGMSMCLINPTKLIRKEKSHYTV